MTTRFLAQVTLRCTKDVIDFPWVFENLNLNILHVHADTEH